MQRDNNFNKRAIDMTETGLSPTIFDVWQILVEIRDRLDVVERQQAEHSTAFLVNDLSRPDFDGHRRSHSKLVKSEEVMDSYKNEATKKFIGIVVVFVIGLLSSGFIAKLAESMK